MTTPTRAEFEAAALPPVPTLTDEERQFLHYNPNTQDLVDFVQGHAVAYAKLAVAAAMGWPTVPEQEKPHD